MKLVDETEVMFTLLTLIASILVMIPIAQSSPETYGPRLDEMYGRFIESPTAQRFALETGEVDVWFDIREPATVRELEDAGFQMSIVDDRFLYSHIDFNVRDQLNPSGGADPWRSESAPGAYYTYSGAAYTNYVPLDDQAFRHACAHLIPKDEIEAVVYESLTGSAIDSLVPPAQATWYKPDVDGHPHSRAEAVSILQAAGFTWVPGSPNPVAGAGVDYWGETGNWIDPHTWGPMNHITFAGVTLAIEPRSWGRDYLCVREFQAIGLPIEHVEVAFSYLTDTMIDYYQFDMYALEWNVDRFPDHLYSFFHSSNDFVPRGYNIPGVHDPALDAVLEIIQHSLDENEVRQASLAAQDLLATLCVSLPTVTRPGITASAKAGAPGHTDTLLGVVNSHGYGQDHEWTFNSLRWASMETGGNPYGIGGSASYIAGSEPTNYHPGYARTPDEWSVISRLFDNLINIDPYTHDDIPWMATSWSVENWTAPGPALGMNITFTLRDDIYWHDGVPYDANSAKWSLEFTRDQQIGRYSNVWQNLDHIDVHNTYTFNCYYSVTSLWILYDISSAAALFPEHIYAGTAPTFQPAAEPHPTVPGLTKLIGTGPFVYRQDSVWGLGGFAHLTAYRPGPSPVTTHWFMSVEGLDAHGPPHIESISRTPVTPNYDEDVTVTATITDNVEVDKVFLSYTQDLSWHNASMNGVDDTFNATIPAQPYGTLVQYMIYANDTSDNWAMSDLYLYTVEDFVAPEVGLSHVPAYPLPGEKVTVYANVTEPANASGVDTPVFFSYRVNSRPWWNTTMVFNGGMGLYEATIPAYEKHDFVEYFVKALDNAGNTNTTVMHHYEVLRCDVNHNGVVDVYDVYMIADVWESKVAEPEYNSEADINEDGTIDMQDLTVVDAQYGEDS